jgi:hypothetical protein
MKLHRFSSSFLYLLISCSFLVITGCSEPILKMPKSLPPIIKEYKHITLYGNRPGMQNTGIYLHKGDVYSILATGSIDVWPRGAPPYYQYHDVRPEDGWPLMAKVGKDITINPLWGSKGAQTYSTDSGNLYVGIKDGDVDVYGRPLNPNYYDDNTGSFSVDIIAWEREDWVQITDFFEKMKEKDPKNQAIIDAFNQANARKEVYLAEAKASKEIEMTKKELQGLKKLQELKEEPEKEKEQVRPTAEVLEKQEKVEALETKLSKLTETLAQLEEMKKKFEEERKKAELLSKELAEKETREKDLLTKLEHGSKNPPVIVIASPKDGCKLEGNIAHLSGVAADDQGLERLEIFINNKRIEKKMGRGITIKRERYPKRLRFSERIALERGENKIKLRAIDADGLSSEKILTVHKVELQKNIWAAVIGINSYPHVRTLHYAVNDARAFYDHLVHSNQIPAENVTLLIDQDASLTKLRSTLGTHLKSKAGKDDMVIIYFAGHGATEKDVMSPDGDGLEKYLLPYDANPKDLYATALPMREISRIFNRIRSERLIFIADSCYSGASGGRTISVTGIRATISDAFLDRIAGGKGRIILTASGANEVSAEDANLHHGVFTYFLLEGLQGKADTDKDGVVTVDEAYAYVSTYVPQATGQEQHPVKKGIVEGRLVLSISD